MHADRCILYINGIEAVNEITKKEIKNVVFILRTLWNEIN